MIIDTHTPKNELHYEYLLNEYKFNIKEAKRDLQHKVYYALEKNNLDYKKAYQEIHKAYCVLQILKDELKNLKRRVKLE